MANKQRKTVAILGMGAVGQALAKVLEPAFEVVAVDVGTPPHTGAVDVALVCYPFHIDDFVGTTVRYVEKYKPSLVIVNSTVVPGTTRKIADRVSCGVAYSPVRGKHNALAD